MAIIQLGELEKASVLAALYNAAKPSIKELSSYDSTPMTYQEARAISFQQDRFDYIKGRIVLVIFVNSTFNSKLYDKNNGNNAAGKIIESLQKTGDVNNPTIVGIHKKNVNITMQEVKNKY